MNILKSIILLSTSLTLVGCFENHSETNKLCSKNPALQCDLLNMNDGQCRLERVSLIWHRDGVLRSPTDMNKIEEFNLVQQYRKCLELAAQIELNKAENKKEARFNALMHSMDEERRIIQELNKSNNPSVLYFLWTQGQKSAIRKLLKLEGQSELNTAELQYALATYYITRDKEKTITLLNNALELSSKDNINIDIIESLASVNHSLNRRKRAYVWAIVGQKFDAPIVSKRNLMALYQFTDQEKELLRKKADRIVDAINKGAYKRSLISHVKIDSE